MRAALTPMQEVMGHLLLAIGQHRRTCARQGVRPPAGLLELEALARFGVSEGQRGSSLAALAATAESEDVPVQLLTYEATATVLSCSLKTVKRLVSDGSLVPVRIGGLARIRVADLNAYVANLGEAP